MLEHKYLKFLSDITKDIRAKEVFTEAGIEQLFQSHVAGSRHELREVEASTCSTSVLLQGLINACTMQFPTGYHVAKDSTAEERTGPDSPHQHC